MPDGRAERQWKGTSVRAFRSQAALLAGKTHTVEFAFGGLGTNRHWGAPRNRQVRIEGTVLRVPDAESDAYFASRPRQAQLASAASPQSRSLRDRAELEQLVRDLEAKTGDGNVPRPPHWGGYVLAPASVEFWQGRDARLHDRLRFVRDRDSWRVERLAP